MLRRLGLVLVVIALAAMLAPLASAARRPTSGEAHAIRAASDQWLRRHLEPAFLKSTRIQRIVVSSVDHRYARVDILIKRVGYDAMILRATSRGWRVRDFGSGGFGCDLAPRAVMRDLFGGCVPSATPATRKRPPTAAERAAIRAAWASFLAKPNSPAASDDSISRIWIAKSNTSYARIDLSSPTVGPSIALLHKRGGVWRIRQFGSADFSCRAAPARVWRDLFPAGFCV